MAIGLVGRKRGMTRIFTEDGASVPVTVIEAFPNRVTRVKSAESDGYAAVQVTTGSVKLSRMTKVLAGQYAKVGAEPGEGLWEFRVTADEAGAHPAGSEITVESFTAGQLVDVRGTTIGKGYAGTIKRHNFQSQDATHGNSVSHRAAWFHRSAPDPGSGVQGQADVRPHGPHCANHAESRRRAGRQGPQFASDSGGCARTRGLPRRDQACRQGAQKEEGLSLQ